MFLNETSSRQKTATPVNIFAAEVGRRGWGTCGTEQSATEPALRLRPLLINAHEPANVPPCTYPPEYFSLFLPLLRDLSIYQLRQFSKYCSVFVEGNMDHYTTTRWRSEGFSILCGKLRETERFLASLFSKINLSKNIFFV